MTGESDLAVWPNLADWIEGARRESSRPVVIGLCGPQGSGKTTGCAALRRLLEARGLATAVLSIDDLYLPRAARLDLAARVHPLLATRGPPGTHDPALGIEVLDRLGNGEAVRLPRFDKGTDDRAPPADWPVLDGPVQVTLFEGWCVGAAPQSPDELVEPINALERGEDEGGVWRRFVNDALRGYAPLFDRIDRLVMLVPPSFDVVTGWRQEQEAALRTHLGGAGRAMSDPEVARFVAHYERLTRHILREMPARADAVLRLGPTREPLSLRFATG